MGGAPENAPGAVLHQDEIGDVDRQFAARVERMKGRNAGIVPLFFGGLDRLLSSAQAVALGDELLRRFVAPGHLLSQRVVRRQGHEAGAEQCVVAGGVNVKLVVAPGQRKRNPQPVGLTDPVVLHAPDPLRPAVQSLKRFQQIVAELGQGEDPLVQFPLLHRRARPPSHPVDDLFVGQDGAIDRIPIDPRFPSHHQPGFQKVQKQLLLVDVVPGMAGGDFPGPVQGQPHAL